MSKEKVLFFRGSKERLKRNITKCAGTLRENQRFEIVWRSKYFRWGLSYRFRCRYEKVEEGYRITYSCAPTVGTFLWVGILFGALLIFALQECISRDYESAVGVGVVSLLYPGVAVWQVHSCHREFRRFFSVATGNKGKTEI